MRAATLDSFIGMRSDTAEDVPEKKSNKNNRMNLSIQSVRKMDVPNERQSVHVYLYLIDIFNKYLSQIGDADCRNVAVMARNKLDNRLHSGLKRIICMREIPLKFDGALQTSQCPGDDS